MQTKVQGLLLTKRPFKDNHLLCHLLLRNGHKIASIFYGGRGGGKRNSPSLLELGYMLDLELAKTKKNSDLYRSKEWSNGWIHQLIRKNFKAYYLLCFFLEVTEKVAPEEDLWEVQDFKQLEGTLHDPNLEYEGLFRVLSNNIFYLEKQLEQGQKNFTMLCANFLCKLIYQQGFMPTMETCCLSDEPLHKNEKVIFMYEKGGFAKLDYVRASGLDLTGMEEEGETILDLFSRVTFQKTAELEVEAFVPDHILRSIFHYFCFQNQLQADTFKTYKSMFQ